MKANTLLILGDSTSMTIGAEAGMYPHVMAREAQWPDAATFVNCSLPGITSADACAFFFEYVGRSAAPGAVVMSVGTCDAMSTEVRKGRYTRQKQAVAAARRALGRAPARTRLRNRLLHFSWNSDIDTSIEAPESAEDYRFNLERVLQTCRARHIPVVLLRPQSNRHFPPGVGKGNFVFYSYLGIPARVADRLSIPDTRFIDATWLFEHSEFDAACASYKEILSAPGALASNAEYTLVLVNNYAVAAARAGRHDEARSLLRLLLKERGVRREIVLFNLAQVAKAAGQIEESTALFEESYEADCSLYRIRSPYLQVLDALGREYSDIAAIVDMASVVDDRCYVDHCHALPDGQRRVAGAVAAQLQAMGFAGTSQATIQNDLRNPEFANGNTTEFFRYFRTYGSLTTPEIGAAVERLRARLSSSTVGTDGIIPAGTPEEVSSAIEYAQRHPMFPTTADVLRFGPEHPSDIGRFPELFLVRHVIPYVRVLEWEPDLTHRFDSVLGVLQPSAALLRILPTDVARLVRRDIHLGTVPEEAAYVDRVLSSVEAQLSNHLAAGNQVYERVKSTIFWYFREVLRYGSHSRVSMRYDRTALEFMAEALAVASVIDARLQLGRTPRIVALIAAVQQAVRIHDHHAARVVLMDEQATDMDAYDRALQDLAASQISHAAASA